MATLGDFIGKIIPIANHANGFKVGKTGQTVDERFRTGHAANYKNITEIGFSDEKDEIDGIEISLISYFKRNFPKCENDQEGGGDMCQSNRYRIYVVWN